MSVAEVEEIAEEEMAQFHTVVSGNTLGKIAKEFYGDAMKYPVIFEAKINQCYLTQIKYIQVRF